MSHVFLLINVREPRSKPPGLVDLCSSWRPTGRVCSSRTSSLSVLQEAPRCSFKHFAAFKWSRTAAAAISSCYHTSGAVASVLLCDQVLLAARCRNEVLLNSLIVFKVKVKVKVIFIVNFPMLKIQKI